MKTVFEQLQGEITGEGSRIILLSHGFGSDKSVWSAFRPWLEARFKVVAFNLAGCGAGGEDSYDHDRHSSLLGYADDLLEIVNDLGIERCSYIAHSVSGMIGAAAATVSPELFERVIMIGSSPRYLNDRAYHGGFEQADIDGLHDSMAANFQAWAAGFVPAVVGVPDNDAIDEFTRTLFLMRPDIALETSRTIFQSDMRDLAPRLACPVHVIQADRDMAVPMEVGQWLHRHIAGSTLDTIEAQGHLPHLTAPAEILQILDHRLSH